MLAQLQVGTLDRALLAFSESIPFPLTDAPMLDEQQICFLSMFRKLYGEGVSGPEQLAALLGLLEKFLAEQGDLPETLERGLHMLSRATTHVAAGYAMETTAIALFEHLHIPALIAEGNNNLAETPVTIRARGDGQSRPSLEITINYALADRLVVGWNYTVEELERTFEKMLRLLFNYGLTMILPL